jgi:hypothetical protein
VESHIATHVPAVRAYWTVRAHVIASLGPLTSLGGVVWAFAQPDRVTLLHPRGQGFWWLVTEPPLLVVAVGLAFAVFVAKPLIADLEEDSGAA